jgi:hypothetical protein
MPDNNDLVNDELSTRFTSFIDTGRTLLIAIEAADFDEPYSNTEVLSVQEAPHVARNIEVNPMRYVEMDPLALCAELYSWCVGCDFE